MLLDFVKLITLQCSILSNSTNYDFNMNLNLIFVQVPSLNLGYEGMTWFSDVNGNSQQLHEYYNEFSLNMQGGLDPERMLFQNFGKDNVVFYYQKPYYNESFILQTLEEQIEVQKSDLINIRVYFAQAKPDVSLQQLIESYWEGKNKQLTFSGSFSRFDEYEMFNLVNNLIIWNDNPDVAESFAFKSKHIVEFKNEFLELLKMPKGKDFFVFLHGDDCPKCDAMKPFYSGLADQLAKIKNIYVGHADMSASIFWGIWPYDLPHTRWYTHTVSNNFEYVYEAQTMEAYFKFLKTKSLLFKKHLSDQHKPKSLEFKYNSAHYHIRHSHNFLNDTQGLVNYFKHHNVDYDHIVDLELQKPYAEKLDGYNIYSFDSFDDIELKYPFFKVVNKVSGADMKCVLVGASLYDGDREKLFMLMTHGYMVVGIQSYRSWPIFNKWEFDTDSRIASLDRGMEEIMKDFSGWLHNQPDPHRHFNNFIPRMNYAESDLQWSMTMHFLPKEAQWDKKEYDVCFVNVGNSSWHSDTKNYTLAMASFEEILSTSSHKIMMIGRKPPDHLINLVDYREFMPFSDFLVLLAKCDILFNPSVSDASPRILTQALTLDTAIIVNKYIAGGSKYVNDETGVLIEDEHDVVEAINTIKRRRAQGILRPRAWYEPYAKLIHQKLEIFIEMVRKEMFYDKDVNGYKEDFTAIE